MLWLIFILVSLLLIITLYYRYFRKVSIHSVDDLVHKTGIVIKPIGGTPLESGSVRLNHNIWPAVSDVPIPKGSQVQVTSIEGIRLIVIPLSKKDDQ